VLVGEIITIIIIITKIIPTPRDIAIRRVCLFAGCCVCSCFRSLVPIRPPAVSAGGRNCGARAVFSAPGGGDALRALFLIIIIIIGLSAK